MLIQQRHETTNIVHLPSHKQLMTRHAGSYKQTPLTQNNYYHIIKNMNISKCTYQTLHKHMLLVKKRKKKLR